MKLRLSLLAAASSAIVLLTALPIKTARRPRYGGTLRVEIGTSVKALDPAVPAANSEEEPAKEQIDSLIYDVLEPKTKFTVNGAFHVTAFEAGKRVVLAANEDYPQGRPFVDSIEITMGRAARERILDLELNKTDFAEIPAEDARRAAERGVRVSRSKPDRLLALFIGDRGVTRRGEAREAIALSIDRAAIVNFILQKEGEPAGGLLPQWSSGTAFLFSTAADPVHAKELWTQFASSPKLVLGYDSGDSLEQAVAERIVVDAREAGISLNLRAVQGVYGPMHARPDVDIRLTWFSLTSKRPDEAFEGFIEQLGLIRSIDAKPQPIWTSPEAIYEHEREMVSSYRIVPLVWLPRVYGLSARVRDWTPPGPGESWPLADVWLDGPVEAAAEEGTK